VASSDRNRAEYARRVNRVLDHIRDHRSEDLSLERLAAVASFSPFHFHRVFKAIVGENLREHIQRTRLENSANALITRPHADILEIALENGFNSASAFSRAFKERFGVTASEWRQGRRVPGSKPGEADRKPGQAASKPGKAGALADPQDASLSGAHAGEEEETMNVKVETLPAYRVAYLRYIGPYAAPGVSQLWQRMIRWASARDLWKEDRICLGIPHDNPHVTDPARCRLDAALVVPPGFTADGEVNVMDVPGGRYALAPFVGKGFEIGAVYDRLFGEWLPKSGYQPDDRLIFELYRGQAFDPATGNFTCDVCAPVRPL
jgi:AraC family transcriptional regulator